MTIRTRAGLGAALLALLGACDNTTTGPAAPRFTPVTVVTARGTVLDASPDWALYVYGIGNDFLQLLNVRTGDDRTLYAESSVSEYLEGAVTSAGGVVDFGAPCCGKRSGVWEWGGSNSGSSGLGASPRGRGRWAAWKGGKPGEVYNPGRLTRDDVLAPSLSYTPDGFSVQDFDLADDGTIAIASGSLYVWRGTTLAPLAAYPDSFVRYPVTDGSNFLYLLLPRATGAVPVLVYRGADGHQETLTGPLAALGGINNPNRYHILNGWAAFEKPDASGAFHIFVRTPSGEVHAVWPAAPADAMLRAVGPNGEVVLSSGTTLYLSDAPHTAAYTLGSFEGLRNVKWIDGKLYVIAGPTLTRIDRS